LKLAPFHPLNNNPPYFAHDQGCAFIAQQWQAGACVVQLDQVDLFIGQRFLMIRTLGDDIAVWVEYS